MIKKSKSKKKNLVTLSVLIIVIVMVISTMPTSKLFAASNETTYTIKNDWGGGASVGVTVMNNNDFPISDWVFQWEFPEDQQISAFWGANYEQNGNSVTVTPPSWTPEIPANGSVYFGFMIGYTTTNSIPEHFLLNGYAFGVTDYSETSSTNTTTNISQLTWTSSDQWAKLTTEGYTLYNNIWGNDIGTQTIWATAYNNWGVTADHPNTGGIKSYPNCEKVVDKTLDNLNSCKSSFACDVPDAGAYNTAYDIWCDNHAYEIMLWMNWNGEVGPIARGWEDDGTPIPEYSNIPIGGNNWNVYKGTNGVNQVYSFLKTTQTNSGNVDVKAVLDWIRNEGWFGNVTLNKVQLGWEITSASGGLDFEMNDYSVTYD
ncbi:MAG: cellulose binding domain-containing protein [Clostridiales bacterium]